MLEYSLNNFIGMWFSEWRRMME